MSSSTTPTHRAAWARPRRWKNWSSGATVCTASRSGPLRFPRLACDFSKLKPPLRLRWILIGVSPPLEAPHRPAVLSAPRSRADFPGCRPGPAIHWLECSSSNEYLRRNERVQNGLARPRRTDLHALPVLGAIQIHRPPVDLRAFRHQHDPRRRARVEGNQGARNDRLGGYAEPLAARFSYVNT